MIKIKEGQTTITEDEKIKAIQELKFIIYTYPDKIRKLRLEIREFEQDISDAEELLEKVNKLEVV